MTAPSEIGWYRKQRYAIGTITPSGNLTVERVTAAILADFPEVSGHYSRTPVSGSKDPFPKDYDWDGMLTAARLLGDGNVDVIVWNGSKGAGLGFAPDVELCKRITDLTGIKATTSILAMERVLLSKKMHRIAIVTPYTSHYQARLLDGFVRAGFDCVADAHANISDNLSYSTLSDAAIVSMFESVMPAKPDAVLAVCTNLPAAHLVAQLEARFGVPVYDSVSIGVWAGLRAMGVATDPAAQWGSLFADAALS